VRLLFAADRTADSPTVSWRLLGLLFVGSGALGALTLPLGQADSFERWPIAVVAAVAIVFGLVTALIAPKLPAALLIAAMVGCVSLVSSAVAVSGGPRSPYLLLYAWTAVEASFFLPRRTAAWFTAASSVLIGVTLAIAGDGLNAGASLAWVMVVGTMAAVGALTATLRARSDDLIEMLADRAMRDPLTGLANRRGYHERIAAELERARRHDLPLSIVLADIDDFKALNDAFGHREGDGALRAFADLCRAHVRGADLVSRVGGEEFAILLPHVGHQGALVTAERLRRAVRTELRGPGGRGLSASFGIASYPQHGDDPEILLDHADQAMYAAKHLGRDRTVVFSHGLLEAVRENAPAEQLQAVLVLAEALDLRDVGTSAHSQTVGGLCADIAGGLGFAVDRVERVRLAGVLHDVGKLGVPDEILRKPAKLTDAEFAEMRKHSELGARMVAAAGMDDVSQWVLAHHERPDGRGYPFGLSGDAIPVEARILAVADAYEAMTADRPYRDAPGHDFAVGELRRCSGTQFDPAVVEALLLTVGSPSPAS
jgi:diguanylate cyclase (GGDEF)-like protein